MTAYFMDTSHRRRNPNSTKRLRALSVQSQLDEV